MTRRVYVDRSRVDSFQRCARQRYLNYHQSGTGIAPINTPLPLAVGKAVHAGLAELLISAMARYKGVERSDLVVPDELMEAAAVQAALEEFNTEIKTLALDTMEDAAVTSAMAPAVAGMNEIGDVPGLDRIVQDAVRGKSEFDKYLAAEQSSLVEGQVRAYARRRLRPLLEQFEVLEVEREGEWLLADWEWQEKEGYIDDHSGDLEHDTYHSQLWFMSRPDALLRERSTNQLYLLSFKTAASWDVRKARDAEHDMQGLSEGVEVERRLAEWWRILKEGEGTFADTSEQFDAMIEKLKPLEGCGVQMVRYLRDLDAPPRIHAIRYEYILKGDRWRDKDLSAKFGFEARAQRSVLVRGYINTGMAAGDERWCHSWDYLKDTGTGETSKLNYRTWKSEPVWTHMPIAKWIDQLDASVQTVSGETGAELGYSSPAQSVGYTATHPLDDVFIPPIVIYRNDDDLRDWIEQTESQERRVAEALVQLESASDEDQRRSLLNQSFPQTRRACSYPTECVFTPICYGGADIRRDPLGSGRYKPRQVNHPQEVQS